MASERPPTPRRNFVVLCACVALCCGALIHPGEGAVVKNVYEWARADNNDPAIADQLNDCYGLTVSPDSKFIYAITRQESSLITLEYDKTRNSLKVVDVKSKGQDGVVGLDHPAAIVMTPDGGHMYVTSPIENSVTHYARDAETGVLTQMETLKDGRDEVTSLWGAASMSMSDDGKRLYVAGKTDHAITTFNIEAGGTLSVAQSVVNDGQGGLHSPAGVTASHDGKYVYTASTTQSIMTVLRRDPTTGVLAVTQRLSDNSRQWGLDATEAIAVSPDDKQVYVLSSSGALTIFSRYDGDPTSPLVPVRRYLEGVDTFTGLIGGRGLTISPDGSTLFVTAETGKLTMLQRWPDGFLTQVGQKTATDIAGINKAARVVVAPNGSIFVGGWGLVSALETTESPGGPIPPPSLAKVPTAPRAPTVPRATTPGTSGGTPVPSAPRATKVPSAPSGPKAPTAPKAPLGPGEEPPVDESTANDETDLDYLESDEALALPPAKIDVIPFGKKKIHFPTGTVVGVAGGLFAFTIIATLADRSATENFCNPVRKWLRGQHGKKKVPYRSPSGRTMMGSHAASAAHLAEVPAMVGESAPPPEFTDLEYQMSVPAAAEDMVLGAAPLAPPQGADQIGQDLSFSIFSEPLDHPNV